MIDDESRFYALSGDIRVGGPSTWHVTDWDQRRVISVTMDGEQESEDVAVEHLRPLADGISNNTYRIKLSQEGKITATYTGSEDDATFCIHYPFLSECSFPPNVTTIRRDDLEEIERLGPDADLVAHPPCSHAAKLVVFKYNWHWQYTERLWLEMNLWMRLPVHPNLVSFDRVVLDEQQNRVVGFTTTYIPNGNLEQNKSRLFKLEWLQQLINLVDLLNLHYGIIHQDIAPQNLLIDEKTNAIKLFDFNFAARIDPKIAIEVHGGERYSEQRNDIKGVIFTMYEIVTQDYHHRDVPHNEQNIDSLPHEWKQHPETYLDHPVSAYQTLLRQWREKRANSNPDQVIPEAIEWPPRPKAPLKKMIMGIRDGKEVEVMEEASMERRRDLLAEGLQVLNWVRPPQRVLDAGTRLLSTGETLRC